MELDFLVNVPIALMAIIGGLLFVPTSKDPATPAVDVLGLVLSTVGITLLVYAIIEAPADGWTMPHLAELIRRCCFTTFAWWNNADPTQGSTYP